MNAMSPRHVRFRNVRPPRAASFSGFYSLRSRLLNSKILQVSTEVQEAIRSRKPVVALETTIYTHGFPYPDNVALASHLELVVRMNGGVPATIGVLHGVARVGLSPEELIELASAAGKKETMKVSRRDLPYITGLGIAGKKINGGTTVAGTMILAQMAGIKIFGTGGLGGVHRGGEHSMDISADLTELGRTSVAVISSGCKSFLDIPRTLEYLETQGVAVSTFADGRTGVIDLPAFWTRDSGVRSPAVVQDEKEAAAIIYARQLLELKSGLFFANPIPLEHSLPKSDVDRAIEEAVMVAERQGIHGYANTPFILERIKQLTEGKSIPANRALVESNVARATKVAVEYSKLISNEELNGPSHMSTYPVLISPEPKSLELAEAVDSPLQPNSTPEADILVAGSVAVDLSCDYAPNDVDFSLTPLPHTSNPAVITQAIGGVGHNVATAAHLIGNDITVRLCSLVADDLAGKVILSSLTERGFDVSAIRTLNSGVQNAVRTAQYVAINDGKKDLAMAMADMRIFSSKTATSNDWRSIIAVSKAKWVVVDANWDELALFQWTKEAKRNGASVAVEPVSVAKASKLFPAKYSEEADDKKEVYPMHDIDLATPNEHELAAIYTAASDNHYLERDDWWKVIDALGISSTGVTLQLRELTTPKLVDEGIPQRMIQLLPFIPNIITKLGARGVVMANLLPTNHPLLQSPSGAPYILSRNMSGSPDVGGVYIRYYPAAETVSAEEIISVNGVGDTFLGVIVAGLAKGLRLDEKLIHLAQKASVLTLRSKEAVSPDIASLSTELET